MDLNYPDGFYDFAKNFEYLRAKFNPNRRNVPTTRGEALRVLWWMDRTLGNPVKHESESE